MIIAETLAPLFIGGKRIPRGEIIEISEEKAEILLLRKLIKVSK